MPGLHGEGLAAAQPAPEEVGGEHRRDEELQGVAQPARGGVAPAAREIEEPGGEEGDREKQDRFVRHGCEPPEEAGRAHGFTSCGGAPWGDLRARAAAAPGIRPIAGAGRGASRAGLWRTACRSRAPAAAARATAMPS